MKKKTFHFVNYTDNCTPKMKKLKTKKAMMSFTKNIQKNTPLHLAPQTGSCIDQYITDIYGEATVVCE
jgi:hypothetical protein